MTKKLFTTITLCIFTFLLIYSFKINGQVHENSGNDTLLLLSEKHSYITKEEFEALKSVALSKGGKVTTYITKNN